MNALNEMKTTLDTGVATIDASETETGAGVAGHCAMPPVTPFAPTRRCPSRLGRAKTSLPIAR